MSPVAILNRFIMTVVAISAGFASSSFAAVVQPVVAGAVQDTFVCASYGANAWNGYMGKRMETNAKKSILTGYSANSLLAPFKARFNGGGGTGAWPDGGEYPGKVLWASIYAWKFSGDASLKARADSLANGLINYQGSDGYLGCADAAHRFGGEGWDVWSCKYCLDGLLVYYIETGDTRALNACVKFGDLACNTFGPGKPIPNIETTTGWWGGLPSTDILESMARLYRYTGTQRYLDFCNYLLTTSSVTRTRNLTLSPTSHINGKGYEQLVNYMGLLEMYRISGNAALLQDAVNCAADVVKNCRQITGTTANGDGIGDTPNPNQPTETCNTVTWAEFNWHLFCITGQPKYAQEIEHTMYNALLGAENARSGSFTDNAGINGTKGNGNGTGSAAEVGGCCGSSMVRGIASFPEWCMAGRVNGNAAIANYFDAIFSIALTQPQARTLTFAMSTTYPENGSVTIAVQSTSAGTYPIMLRVPEWCSSFNASVGGQNYSGTAGLFLTIQRAWGTNETIQVTIGMTPLIVNDPDPASTKKALQRGPQLLSIDPTITGTTLPANWWGNQVYAVTVNQGGQKTWYMVPYAEAGQTGSNQTVLQNTFTFVSVGVAPAIIKSGMSPVALPGAQRSVSINGRMLKAGSLPRIMPAGIRVDMKGNKTADIGSANGTR
jgi:hypothetical protein